MKDLNVQKEWADELREYFDRHLKAKKPGMKNLDREILVDFVRKTLASHNNSLVERLEGLRVDFAAMPKEKRLAMDDGDIGFMNGKNCTIDQAQELIKNSLT